IVSFGHTPFFRYKYYNPVNTLIPDELRKNSYIDLARAIFGIEGGEGKDKSVKFATRVFFEDAEMISGETYPVVKIPKILAGPKSTAFQHYLVQKSGVLNELDPDKGMKHYDSPSAQIRGNKLYWHQKGANWEEES